MTSATVTQDEIDKASTPEKRLKLLESKGIPIKGKNLNTDDYLIGVETKVVYEYTWEGPSKGILCRIKSFISNFLQSHAQD